MKATIEFDEQLYRRLKVEAARRGRTIRELVADAVRNILDAPATPTTGPTKSKPWQPKWLGSLERYTSNIDDHSMSSVRASVSRGRARKRSR